MDRVTETEWGGRKEGVRSQGALPPCPTISHALLLTAPSLWQSTTTISTAKQDMDQQGRHCS